jgi:hypothetical protein
MSALVSERSFGRGALQALLDDTDDIWGSVPRPHIPPLPWLREVLVGVAVSRLATTLDKSSLREELIRTSSNLVAEGIKKAGSNPMPGRS